MFTINAGDVILISGKSGCGKSTLLHMLKGLIPDVIAGSLVGEINFKGKSLINLTGPEKVKIGLVGQNPEAQMICSLVIDELAFGLENLAMPRSMIEQQIKQYANKFKVEHLLKRTTKSLSGGEKQKIALLSVLLANPEVVLLDEPTAFLDPDSAYEFAKSLSSDVANRTIIIVEHNIHYFKNMINRYLVIGDDGNVAEQRLTKVSWKTNLPKLPKPAQNNLHQEPILSISNLTYGYTKQAVLFNNLSLSLDPGEVISIVGRSGAGKSTLLKILARLIKPKSLNLAIRGEDTSKIPDKQVYQYLSLLQQNPENHFLFNQVDQELEHNLKLLEEFTLAQNSQQNPFNLSQGQKRRLSFAIACMLMDRDIYLLDEPTFGQDHQNKLALLIVINRLRQLGKSFIIISHDTLFVEAVSDKILVLENGMLNQKQSLH